jgi:hypothetical protein
MLVHHVSFQDTIDTFAYRRTHSTSRADATQPQWIVPMIAFVTPQIAFMGMGTWIMQMTMTTAARHTMNLT